MIEYAMQVCEYPCITFQHMHYTAMPSNEVSPAELKSDPCESLRRFGRLLVNSLDSLAPNLPPVSDSLPGETSPLAIAAVVDFRRSLFGRALVGDSSVATGLTGMSVSRSPERSKEGRAVDATEGMTVFEPMSELDG